MKSVSKLIAIVLASATLFACASENTGLRSEEVIFQAGITTRVMDGQWHNGDAIGLSMLCSRGIDIINDVYNYQFDTDGSGAFTPNGQSKRIYLPQDGSDVTFRAYYPYYPAMTNTMLFPVNVQTEKQADLASIDLLATTSNATYSKGNNVVNLSFHHQLTFIEFNLKVEEGQDAINLDDISLTIKGMKAMASYCVQSSVLTVDDNSTMDIGIPKDVSGPYKNSCKASLRRAIVLPRAKGEGVEFIFKSTGLDNGSYSVPMNSDLELKAGYKYVMTVTLKKTSAEISVNIVDWNEGGESDLSPVMIDKIETGPNINVKDGDRITIYTKDTPGANWISGTYEYDGGVWKTTTPLYWEDISESATFYASMAGDMVDPAVVSSTNQVMDYFLADPVMVNANSGINLTMKHRVAKVAARLISSDNTFTSAQLAEMSVVLPDYVTGATYSNGSVIMGSNTEDISLTKNNWTSSDNVTYSRTGYVQPQKVLPGKAIAKVGYNGYTYTASSTAAAIYEAGRITMLTIDMKKTGIGISASMIDWVEGQSADMTPVMVNSASAEATTVKAGTKLTIYTEDTVDANWRQAEYSYDGSKWNASSPIYWEELKPAATFYASMEGDMVDPSVVANDSQVMDYLLSGPVTVNASQGVNFKLEHKVAWVAIRLTSTSGTYTDAALNSMTVTLPGYKTGATYSNGSITMGSATATIGLTKRAWMSKDGVTYKLMAFIQPQTIAPGNVIAKVETGGYAYEAKGGEVAYEAGKITMLSLDMNKTGIDISASVVDWSEGEAVDLSPVMIGRIDAGTTTVNPGTTLTIYTQSTPDAAWKQSLYTYNGIGWDTSSPIYWEDLNKTATFYAVLEGEQVDAAVAASHNQIQDYLLSGPVTVNANHGIDFTLKHKAAWAAMQLKSSDGTFDEATLMNMKITLPNYNTGAAYDNGSFVVPSPAVKKDITFIKSKTWVSGVETYTMAAFILPQDIKAGDVVVRIEYGGHTYEAAYTDPVKFEAGRVTKLIVDITKTNAEISAQIIDWVDGNRVSMTAKRFEFSQAGTTSDFFKDKSILIYNTNGNDRWVREYKYSKVGGNYTWNPLNGILYWDELTMPLDLSSVHYPAGIPSASLSFPVQTSFDITIPADQTPSSFTADSYDLLATGKLPRITSGSPAVNFVFGHVFSKVEVVLKPGEGFTLSDLANCAVTLPGYFIGGTVDIANALGGFVSSVSAKDAVKMKNNGMDGANTSINYTAIAMPQTIAKNTDVVSISIPGYSGLEYKGTLAADFKLEPGKVSILTITVQKTKMDISAKYTDWAVGDKGSIIIE